MMGVRILAPVAVTGKEIPGADLKNGALSETDKFDLLALTETSLSGAVGDVALIADFGPWSVAPGDELEFHVILGIGASESEVLVALDKGQVHCDQATAVDSDEEAILPATLTLEQNYPNPFNNETLVEFSLPASGDCAFQIFNVLGREVYSQEMRGLNAGRHMISWDGTNSSGYSVSSGVYLYRISYEGVGVARKMVLLK
jgi:hypothetical protein